MPGALAHAPRGGERLAAPIEARVVDGVVAALLGGDASAQRLADRVVAKVAHMVADRLLETFEAPGSDATKTFAQRVVEAAAAQVVRQQKEEARLEERRRLVRAVRSPFAPQILQELESLAALEASGKVKGARIRLLNMAVQEFGSYAAVLAAVKDPAAHPAHPDRLV